MISVIVPTKNSARTIGECLKSITKQTYADLEIIVVDNESNDQTIEIANKYATKVLIHGPERSAQRNYGVAQASGEYLLIIDSDMLFSLDVAKDCVEAFEKNPDVLALVIPEKSVGTGWWAQCKKLERSFYIGVDWMEAARCFRKSTFDEMGGYDEENTGTEDYDLPQRIETKYGSTVIGRIDAPILHDEGKISLLFSCKKKFYYARQLDVYKNKQQNIEKYKKQSSLLYRYGLFFRHPVRLLLHPVTGIGMLFMKSAEFVAGGLGYLLRKRDNSISSKIYKVDRTNHQEHSLGDD